MIITNNGSIDGIPYNAMIQHNGIWRYLLICRVSTTHTEAELAELFATDTVKDDSKNIIWHYTEFLKIMSDSAYKYVWLMYTETSFDTDAIDALELLGYTESEGNTNG